MFVHFPFFETMTKLETKKKAQLNRQNLKLWRVTTSLDSAVSWSTLYQVVTSLGRRCLFHQNSMSLCEINNFPVNRVFQSHFYS